MSAQARLIVISGLPGVGKTTVASAVAARLGAVHLSVDVIEEALLGSGVSAGWTSGVAAYEAARALAELNLQDRQSVVVDAVNDSEEARDTWRRASRGTSFVTLIVTDVSEHERRLDGRNRGFVHVTEPTWADVEQRSAGYAPWTDQHLEIDTSALEPETVVDIVLRYVASS
ncbi:MAG: AAA family ATPase [Microbacterium sp.]